MIQLSYKQQIAFNSLSIIAGNALYALTVVLFLVPSGLITGGATGIALGVNRVLGLPVSGVLFAINISMLVLGWVVLGSRFALTTIASTILSPLFLALWERVFADFVLTDDRSHSRSPAHSPTIRRGWTGYTPLHSRPLWSLRRALSGSVPLGIAS